MHSSRRLRPASALRSVVALAGVAGVAGLASWSVAARAAPAPAPSQRTEAQWLEAIRQAADQQSYSGIYVYTQGDALRSWRITHTFDGAAVVERVQPMDGELREFVRHGDTVECLYHDQKRVVATHGSPNARFPALVSAAPDDILKHYTFELGGVGRVAGTACQVIRLRPRDELRYGYELCVEALSGLMLKVKTQDHDGAQVDQMAFSELHLGERIDPADVQASWPTTGWARQERNVRAIDLNHLGWIVATPAGFYRHREVARKLVDDGGASPSRETYQSVLSDGLATVSVFIETESAPSFPLDALQRRGPASAYARKVGPGTVTVVGEVPPETVEAIANSVEYRDPH